MYTFIGRIDKIHKVLANSEVETGASYKFQLLKSLSLFIFTSLDHVSTLHKEIFQFRGSYCTTAWNHDLEVEE